MGHTVLKPLLASLFLPASEPHHGCVPKLQPSLSKLQAAGVRESSDWLYSVGSVLRFGTVGKGSRSSLLALLLLTFNEFLSHLFSSQAAAIFNSAFGSFLVSTRGLTLPILFFLKRLFCTNDLELNFFYSLVKYKSFGSLHVPLIIPRGK